MATILDKDITRESTIKVSDREIQVTLTDDQKITLKLKGMKSGIYSIDIGELYAQLAGVEEKAKELKIKRFKSTEEPMISLNRLKSLAMVTKMDLKIKIELNNVIRELINDETFELD